MAQRSTAADVRIKAATDSRAAAVQEAAFYRSKLAALESGAISEASKLELERSADLEKKLAAALSSKGKLQAQYSQVETQLRQERDLRSAAEEHARLLSERGEATQSSYSRSLVDISDLQRRVHAHESTIQTHLEAIASLTSQHEQVRAEHDDLKQRHIESTSTQAQFSETLDQTQGLLATAHTKIAALEDDLASKQQQLEESQTRVGNLESELQRKTLDAQLATDRHTDLSTRHSAQQSELLQLRSLTSNKLSELLSAHQQSTQRSLAEDRPVHAQKWQAAAAEADSLRSLHKEALSRADATQADVLEARSKHAMLEKQIQAFRSEIASLRNQHISAVQDATRLKSDLATKDIDLSEQSRAAEAADTKASLLRSILIEHGIPIDGADGSPRPENGAGGPAVDQLVRRVHELEAQLEARTRAQRSLESAHEDSRRDLHIAEQQLLDASRHKQKTDDQLNQVHQELERARSPTGRSINGDSVDDRTLRAEADLQSLQERHKGLADAHGKAVQYVSTLR